MEKEIIVTIYDNIETIYLKLLNEKIKGNHAYCNLNGFILHSDFLPINTKNSKQITKSEYNQIKKTLLPSSKDFKKIASCNVQNWIEIGKKIISKDKHELWEKCVRSRAKDIYYGFDLDIAIEIMYELKNSNDIDGVVNTFMNENFSNLFLSIVRNIILNFSSKGEEFWNKTTNMIAFINKKEKKLILKN